MKSVFQASLPQVFDAIERFYRAKMPKWNLLDCQSSTDGTQFLVRATWTFNRRVNLKPVGILHSIAAGVCSHQNQPPPWGLSTSVPYELTAEIEARALDLAGDRISVEVTTTEIVDPLCSVLQGVNGRRLLAPSMLGEHGIDDSLLAALAATLPSGAIDGRPALTGGSKSAPTSARALLRSSFELLVGLGVFPSYVESGRFREPPRGKTRQIFTRDDRLLAHYSSAQGELYENDRQWDLARQFIESFTKKGREKSSRRIHLPKTFGAFTGEKPKTVFDKVGHALNRRRFTLLDKDETNLSAVYVLAEKCKAIDLPEPYGKWLQHRKRQAQWTDPEVELEFEVRVKVYSAGPKAETFLDLEISTFALPVVRDLGRELAALLHRAIKIPDDALVFQHLCGAATKSGFRLLLP